MLTRRQKRVEAAYRSRLFTIREELPKHPNDRGGDAYPEQYADAYAVHDSTHSRELIALHLGPHGNTALVNYRKYNKVSTVGLPRSALFSYDQRLTSVYGAGGPRWFEQHGL
jgi:hypothetical protein